MSRLLVLLIIFTMLFSMTAQVSAAETTEATVPVVLTVINTEKPISVTVPAAFPVSVIDGYLVSASNAKIVNNGDRPIQVTGVDVQSGAFQIGNFENFAAGDNSIALSINGCGTTKAGPLTLTEEGFPVIEGQKELPIQYKAKVSTSEAMTNKTIATVVFTIGAAE